MDYVVTIKWKVKVPDDQVKRLSQAYGDPNMDPKKLAVFMAVDKTVSAIAEGLSPDAEFVVEQVTN